MQTGPGALVPMLTRASVTTANREPSLAQLGQLKTPNGLGKTLSLWGMTGNKSGVQALLSYTLKLDDWSSESPENSGIDYPDWFAPGQADKALQAARRRRAALNSWLAKGHQLLEPTFAPVTFRSGPNDRPSAQCQDLHVAAPEGFATQLSKPGAPRPLGADLPNATVTVVQLLGRMVRHGRPKGAEFNALRIERSAARYRALRDLSRSLFEVTSWAEPVLLPTPPGEFSPPCALICGVFRLTVPLVPRAPGQCVPVAEFMRWDYAGVPPGGTVAA